MSGNNGVMCVALRGRLGRCGARAAILLAFGAGVVSGVAGRAGEIEFTYTNPISNSRQKAGAFIPPATATHPRPLLVIAHYAGGNHHTAKALGYYDECDARGWLCVCPRLHGEKMIDRGAFGSIESQHDLLAAIAYMRANYRVDSTRIYLAGRSMGGMTAQLMAAKNPDLFAAVVAGQGISDLKMWVDSIESFRGFIETFACGPYTEKTAFEYARRSSVNYGPNFRYVPLLLWHGSNDRVVPPGHSLRLEKVIAVHSPYQRPVQWLVGAAHGAGGYSARWVCDQLMHYQNVAEPAQKLPGRFFPELELVFDEDRPLFWLSPLRADTSAFAYVHAALKGDTLLLHTRNLRELAVDMQRMPAATRLAMCRGQVDRTLRVYRLGADREAALELEPGFSGAKPFP